MDTNKSGRSLPPRDVTLALPPRDVTMALPSGLRRIEVHNCALPFGVPLCHSASHPDLKGKSGLRTCSKSGLGIPPPEDFAKSGLRTNFWPSPG